MRMEFDLEALTDLCLSSSNRTLGEPQTHDYIPGRTLWGAAANRAYRGEGISEEEAFRLFHQGEVRFLDAVPTWEGRRVFPLPLSWYRPKDAADKNRCYNFALQEVQDSHQDTQCKAVPSGWATPEGHCVEVARHQSLRTAVDPTGRAREGLLFGLPVIKAGTRFWSTVAGDKADLDRVAELLTGRELRLGRSKNAELGLVRVVVRKTGAESLAHGSGKSGQVSFLCVSRCIFRNERTGALTAQPSPEALGLDAGWRFEPHLSFLKPVRVVHFNVKRGRPESERMALERGSVLTFSGPSAVDLTALASLLEAGVGEHRGEGYGEVLVAPTWLTQKEFTLHKAGNGRTANAPEPDDALFKWAQNRARQRGQATDLHREAMECARRLRTFGVPPSQWGELRRMAREARFRESPPERLFETLFDKERGFVTTGKRRLSRQWQRALGPLQKACQEHRQELPVFLELLAGACMRPAGSERTEQQ